MVNHKVIRLVVAFAVGIFLSFYSYQMITDPEPALERAREEAAVYAAREIVRSYIPADDEAEIVDPLAPDRVVGKTYVYPAEGGWQISGYYRRGSADRWHPFLMAIDNDLQLESLSVKDTDSALAELAGSDPHFEVVP